jgi:hypothetical protein
VQISTPTTFFGILTWAPPALSSAYVTRRGRVPYLQGRRSSVVNVELEQISKPVTFNTTHDKREYKLEFSD